MKQRGFALVDVITATVLLGALLLVFSQAQQWQQHQQMRQQWIADAEWLRQAATLFWIERGTAPSTLTDLVADGATEVTRPWQQRWQLHLAQPWLELQIEAPSAAQAHWFAGQLAGALVRSQTVVVPVWKPLIADLDERYLHRLEQPIQPHLNTMATDLDLQSHSIMDVGELHAARVNAEYFLGNTLTAEHIKTEWISTGVLYADDVITPFYSLSEIHRDMSYYRQLWRQCELQGKC